MFIAHQLVVGVGKTRIVDKTKPVPKCKCALCARYRDSTQIPRRFFLPHALSQLGLASGRGLSTLALVGHNDIWLMSYVLFWGQLVHHAIVVKHLLNIYHQSRNLGYQPFLDRPKYRIGCILYIQLISIKIRCSSHYIYICIDLYP